MPTSGNHQEAHKILEHLEHVSKQRYVMPYPVARINMALGNAEKALRQLETSFTAHAAMMIFLKVDPRFSGFHGQPRFQDLLRRMNLL